jgi:hypothetical protein
MEDVIGIRIRQRRGAGFHIREPAQPNEPIVLPENAELPEQRHPGGLLRL